uniref:BZIP domain-containing protein n=1 Tax=Glossina brevipalpis TaxID=37001 RepID=A0A1A9WXI1_9MUSC
MENIDANEIMQYRHKKFDNFKRKQRDSCNSLQSRTKAFESESMRIENLNNSHTDDKESYTNRTNLPCDITIITPPPSKRRRVTFASTHVIPSVETILPRLSDEMLSSIYKYHCNMVRKFPKRQRSPKDQRRRDKNTIACRISRRSKKLEQLFIEEQYREFCEKNFIIKEQSIRANAYLNELNKLINPSRNTFTAFSTDCSISSTTATISSSIQHISATSSKCYSNGNSDASKLNFIEKIKLSKKPFTIAYLTSNE